MAADKEVKDLVLLERLFNQYYKQLRAYAFRFVNDPDLSEDIVQDTFFELWQRRHSIHFQDDAVKSYLFTAVYHRSLNVLKQKLRDAYPLKSGKENEYLEQYLSSYIQTSEQSLLLKELEQEINIFIKTLPPQCHKVFTLSRTYGLKNREIAEQLSISIKAVEKHISKALFGLKEYLIKKGLFPILIFAIFGLL
ncbi:RNA polymerase sigma-70 factor [Prevotella sp. 10(H)]|uniref:RNA polymerase sigma-70 factor n=1 Tax=Prevotella sp. 10(H) TaxID=1158294 RepID=UPI0004A74FE7|nr:RNA polymerase sigma-70 factor [Prevotella sp. 10(H)]